MTKRVDSVLALLRKSEPSNDGLKHLESDVWQRIAFQKAEQPTGVFESWLAVLFPAQHRFAPIMCAAVLGIMLGFGTLPFNQPSPDAAEMLNFKVFKPKVITLASIIPNSEPL